MPFVTIFKRNLPNDVRKTDRVVEEPSNNSGKHKVKAMGMNGGLVRLAQSPIYWMTFIAFDLLAYSLYATLWTVVPSYSDPTNMLPARLPYCILCSALQLVGLVMGIAWLQKRRTVAFGLLSGVL